MTKYEITINEELDRELKQVAEAVGKDVNQILDDFLLLLFRKEKISIIIHEYKNGNIKAREAWKLSGLSYQEFQDLANT
ncbi:MAG: hypothetical protein GPJ54_06920 [Candidatus Heimdallarchaeota archaeon]|nr:hypothetical protein [Candidatus Heimdallarchaeota archaeon]